MRSPPRPGCSACCSDRSTSRSTWASTARARSCCTSARSWCWCREWRDCSRRSTAYAPRSTTWSGSARTSHRARRLGFGAKLCIHPKQVAPGARLLAPDAGTGRLGAARGRRRCRFRRRGSGARWQDGRPPRAAESPRDPRRRQRRAGNCGLGRRPQAARRNPKSVERGHAGGRHGQPRISPLPPSPFPLPPSQEKMIRDQETMNSLLDSRRRASCASASCRPRHLVAETDRDPRTTSCAEMKALGLFGLTIPEEYGGLGLTMEEEVLVMFELGHTSPALPLAVRHQCGHRLAGHRDGRHRRAEGAVAAAARHRRAHRLVRADRAGGRLRRRVAAHHRDPRRRPLRGQRHQALHHQRAARGHLHGDGAHRSRSQGRRRRLGLHRRRGARRASASASPTRRWASRARTPAT